MNRTSYLSAAPEENEQIPYLPYRSPKKRNIWQFATLLLALLFGASVAYNILHHDETAMKAEIANEKVLAERQMKEAALNQNAVLAKAFESQEQIITKLTEQRVVEQKLQLSIENERTKTRDAINNATFGEHFEFFSDYARKRNLRSELTQGNSPGPGGL